MHYANCRNVSVEFNDKDHLIRLYCRFSGERTETLIGIIDSVKTTGDTRNILHEAECSCSSALLPESGTFTVEMRDFFSLEFTLTENRIGIRSTPTYPSEIGGTLLWGTNPEENTFAVELTNPDPGLFSQSGPAVPRYADALFDRDSGRVMEFRGNDICRLHYDWNCDQYRFTAKSKLDRSRRFEIVIHENYYHDRFGVDFHPIRKKHGFLTPPVGWMTWYSLQFQTCADAVWENAVQLHRLFGSFCSRLCVWVDWEWCHRDWSGTLTGCDTMHPRADVYPDGLAPLAGKIRNLGLIPALWTGVTNDGIRNGFMEEHPECVLAQSQQWCGQWWIDPTHPLSHRYVAKVFRWILDQGFRMIKWDCLPSTLMVLDEFHEKFYDPSVSSDTALRELIHSARREIGDKVYLLSCSGNYDREVLLAPESFDAARTGGDVFDWESFIKSFDRGLHSYVFHNVLFYADADNIVLRSEHNTPGQARIRAAFFGLGGFPLTIGDDLRCIPEFETDLLRQLMPVADIHPGSLVRTKRGEEFTVLSLSIARRFGSWLAAAVLNFSQEDRFVRLYLDRDLHWGDTDGTRYAVCDLWNEKFLGITEKDFTLDLPGLDAVALRITPLHDRPTVIFCNRHITQGGVEMSDLCWDEKTSVLSGWLDCAAEREIKLKIWIPEGYAVTGSSGVGKMAPAPEAPECVQDLNIAGAGVVFWKVDFRTLPDKPDRSKHHKEKKNDF